MLPFVNPVASVMSEIDVPAYPFLLKMGAVFSMISCLVRSALFITLHKNIPIGIIDQVYFPHFDLPSFPNCPMFTEIDRFVARYVQLTDEESAFFHSRLKLRHYKKKTFLLQEGEICGFEAFILKGCIRSYYHDKEGTETIL